MKPGRPASSASSLKPQREGLLVGEHVLAERGTEFSEPLDDLGEPVFCRVIEGGSGAAEAGVIALEHALLLGVEAGRIGRAHHRIDAAEQRRTRIDLVPMAGKLRRQFALDCEQRVVGIGAGQDVEDLVDALQRPPAEFQRFDCIGETRRLGVRLDGRDLGFMLGNGAGKGRPELLGRDVIERRNTRPGWSNPGLEGWRMLRSAGRSGSSAGLTKSGRRRDICHRERATKAARRAELCPVTPTLCRMALFRPYCCRSPKTFRSTRRASASTCPMSRRPTVFPPSPSTPIRRRSPPAVSRNSAACLPSRRTRSAPAPHRQRHLGRRQP